MIYLIVRGVNIKNKVQSGIFILHIYDKIAINSMDIGINGLCIFYQKWEKGENFFLYLPITKVERNI